MPGPGCLSQIVCGSGKDVGKGPGTKKGWLLGEAAWERVKTEVKGVGGRGRVNERARSRREGSSLRVCAFESRGGRRGGACRRGGCPSILPSPVKEDGRPGGGRARTLAIAPPLKLVLRRGVCDVVCAGCRRLSCGGPGVFLGTCCCCCCSSCPACLSAWTWWEVCVGWYQGGRIDG